MTDPTQDPRISAYLDGELAPAEQAEFETWLAAHPDAQRLVDELGAMSRTIQALPRLTVGRDLTADVVAKLDAAGATGDGDGRAGSVAGDSTAAAIAPPAGGAATVEARGGAGWNWRAPAWAAAAIAAALLVMAFTADPDREVARQTATGPSAAESADARAAGDTARPAGGAAIEQPLADELNELAVEEKSLDGATADLRARPGAADAGGANRNFSDSHGNARGGDASRQLAAARDAEGAEGLRNRRKQPLEPSNDKLPDSTQMARVDRVTPLGDTNRTAPPALAGRAGRGVADEEADWTSRQKVDATRLERFALADAIALRWLETTQGEGDDVLVVEVDMRPEALAAGRFDTLLAANDIRLDREAGEFHGRLALPSDPFDDRSIDRSLKQNGAHQQQDAQRLPEIAGPDKAREEDARRDSGVKDTPHDLELAQRAGNALGLRAAKAVDSERDQLAESVDGLAKLPAQVGDYRGGAAPVDVVYVEASSHQIEAMLDRMQSAPDNFLAFNPLPAAGQGKAAGGLSQRAPADSKRLQRDLEKKTTDGDRFAQQQAAGDVASDLTTDASPVPGDEFQRKRGVAAGEPTVMKSKPAPSAPAAPAVPAPAPVVAPQGETSGEFWENKKRELEAAAADPRVAKGQAAQGHVATGQAAKGEAALGSVATAPPTKGRETTTPHFTQGRALRLRVTPDFAKNLRTESIGSGGGGFAVPREEASTKTESTATPAPAGNKPTADGPRDEPTAGAPVTPAESAAPSAGAAPARRTPPAGAAGKDAPRSGPVEELESTRSDAHRPEAEKSAETIERIAQPAGRQSTLAEAKEKLARLGRSRDGDAEPQRPLRVLFVLRATVARPPVAVKSRDAARPEAAAAEAEPADVEPADAAQE